MRAFDDLVNKRKGECLIGDGDMMTVADIAVVCAVVHIDFAKAREGWREELPGLAKWFDGMDSRTSFASTRPVMFDIKVSTVDTTSGGAGSGTFGRGGVA
jgi:glutathione S-transferase